jgi:hypothetical protein
VWFEILKTTLIHPTFFCGENLPKCEKKKLVKALVEKNGFIKRNHHILTSTRHIMAYM